MKEALKRLSAPRVTQRTYIQEYVGTPYLGDAMLESSTPYDDSEEVLALGEASLSHRTLANAPLEEKGKQADSCDSEAILVEEASESAIRVVENSSPTLPSADEAMASTALPQVDEPAQRNIAMDHVTFHSINLLFL